MHDVKIKEGETTDAQEQGNFREGEGGYSDDDDIECLSRDMCFPTMWHFHKCRLIRACTASNSK